MTGGRRAREPRGGGGQPGRVVNRAGRRDAGDYAIKLVFSNFIIGHHMFEQRGVGAVRSDPLTVEKRRQGDRALTQVISGRLAEFLVGTGHIQNVVPNLEGQSDFSRELSQFANGGFRSTPQNGAHLGGPRKQ